MSYASWMPRHRVTSTSPGKLDLFVVTFVNGRRAAIDPVTEYEAALARANEFAKNHKCQIKVLSLTGLEFINLFRIDLPTEPAPDDPQSRKLITDTLRSIARDSNDPDASTDAFDLLTSIGVIQS